MKTISVDTEYKKNKDLKKYEVDSLMEWVEIQPHLPKITELDAILFLHSCFYNQEQAKHTIDCYYTCRTHCDDIFRKWNPLDAQVKKAIEVMVFYPLPGETPDGNKVFYIRIMDSDASKFYIYEQMRSFLMQFTIWLAQEGSANGHIIIVDISGITPSHLMKMNPFYLKKFFFFLQQAIPIRLKGIYLFNCVSFIDKLVMILKPFIQEGTFFTYTPDKCTDLFNVVPQKMFPEDYGGQAPSSTQLHYLMKKSFTDNKDFLEEVERTQYVNEKLRPGKDYDILGSDDQKSCAIS